eukprot:6459012-Amphidinium_carterae.1
MPIRLSPFTRPVSLVRTVVSALVAVLRPSRLALRLGVRTLCLLPSIPRSVACRLVVARVPILLHAGVLTLVTLGLRHADTVSLA